MRFVRKAFIWPDVLGSDHCPVGVDADPAIKKEYERMKALVAAKAK